MVTILALGLAASLLATSQAAPRPPYGSVVIFGDSLSDNGNVYALTDRTWPADPAYYAGRFSNGPVWAEHLAASLSVPLHDYAYGGATTSNTLVRGYTGPKADIPVPSLEDQVSGFLSSAHHDVTRSLFILWGGANDVLSNGSVTAAQSAAVIARLVARLQGAGGASILLVGSPDLSMIPWANYVDGASREVLHAYSAGLSNRLGRLARGAAVKYAGLDPLFRSLRDRSGFNGSCLVGTYTKAPRSLCKDADKYVFWDEFHPTARVHELIATALGKAAGCRS